MNPKHAQLNALEERVKKAEATAHEVLEYADQLIEEIWKMRLALHKEGVKP